MIAFKYKLIKIALRTKKEI